MSQFDPETPTDRISVTPGQFAAEQRRMHARFHGEHVPFEDCFRCGRQLAVCKSKIRFLTPWEAQEWADDLNLSREHKPPVVVIYRCRWGVDVHWHTATARRRYDHQRVERQRRKLLRRNLT